MVLVARRHRHYSVRSSSAPGKLERVGEIRR
jgi:hypothetical protein